jgi:uncharacterized protein (DUF305 family)
VIVLGQTFRPRRASRRTVASLLAAALPIGIGACIDDETAPRAGGGNGIDRAFLAEMIPHDRFGLAMAKVARSRSSRPQIRRLANTIMGTRRTEISSMRRMARRLEDVGVREEPLGIPMHEQGMDGERQIGSRWSDRTFIDAMIRHHQGAIRMARVVIEQGEAGDLRAVAKAIVRMDAKEIEDMNAWRRRWYGRSSPAGGVAEAKSHHAG